MRRKKASIRRVGQEPKEKSDHGTVFNGVSGRPAIDPPEIDWQSSRLINSCTRVYDVANEIRCTTEQLDSPGRRIYTSVPLRVSPLLFFFKSVFVHRKAQNPYRSLPNNSLRHSTKRERHKENFGYLPTSCDAKCRLQCYLQETPDGVTSGLVYGTEWWCWFIYIPAYGL